MRDALSQCVEPGFDDGEDRLSFRASAAELLPSIRELALERFGTQAKAVFKGWHISRTEDFGEIVFDRIESEVLTRPPEDSKKDFRDGYDFDEAFPVE